MAKIILSAKESLRIQERFGLSVQEIDELLRATIEARNAFVSTYVAVTKDRTDEALLHCGAQSSKLSKFVEKIVKHGNVV